MGKVRVVGLGALLLATACGTLLAAGSPADAAGQAAKAKAAAPAAKGPAQKAPLPGATWDSIKSLPDWSGMWTPGRGPAPPPGTAAPARAGGPPPAGAPAAGPGGPPGAPGGPPGAAPGGGRPGGGGGFGAGAPYKPEIAAKNAARFQRVLGQGPGGEADIPLSNSGFCIPGGFPGNMGLVSHEYFFSPGKVLMVLENSELRHIFTDGRGHVPEDESNPSFQGDSIGHWEGDTLVVETVNIYPEAEFTFGNHVTSKTVIKERITRIGNKLRDEMVITDPDLFTGPWNMTRWYDREDRPYVEYEPCTMADRAVKQGDVLKGIDFNPNRNALGGK